MTKNPRLIRDVAGVLLIALLLMSFTWLSNRPDDPGAPFTGVLEAVEVHNTTLTLDFGFEHDMEIDRSASVLALTAPEALGRSYTGRYTYTGREGSRGKNGGYHQHVTELTADDGSFAFTWEEYAALHTRSALVSAALTGLAALAVGGVHLFALHRKPPAPLPERKAPPRSLGKKK